MRHQNLHLACKSYCSILLVCNYLYLNYQGTKESLELIFPSRITENNCTMSYKEFANGQLNKWIFMSLRLR
ncbi:unnamed protein product, partial [Vitis vinifera]|uniref:Uncharacterized protein n=1 Tax=Vitis vinifera TaxID=29760 RepID=D7T9M1_VITVI